MCNAGRWFTVNSLHRGMGGQCSGWKGRWWGEVYLGSLHTCKRVRGVRDGMGRAGPLSVGWSAAGAASPALCRASPQRPGSSQPTPVM